jgi:Zn-dependent peptidase ImmA (M78 family)
LFIKTEGCMLQASFKPKVVWLILNGKPDEALTLLAENYKVTVPKLKVGLPKGRKATAFGVYTSKNETISVLNSDVLVNPFIILHEFYHHLRSRGVDKQHRGTEKNADKFAVEFIEAYKAAARSPEN